MTSVELCWAGGQGLCSYGAWLERVGIEESDGVCLGVASHLWGLRKKLWNLSKKSDLEGLAYFRHSDSAQNLFWQLQVMVVMLTALLHPPQGLREQLPPQASMWLRLYVQREVDSCPACQWDLMWGWEMKSWRDKAAGAFHSLPTSWSQVSK